MKFNYRRYRVQYADGAGPATVYRPVVPLAIHGPRAMVRRMALVDTGADFTLLPSSLGQELGVAFDAQNMIELTGIGEAVISASPATVAFELRQGEETVRWQGRAYFADQDYLLLGNEGFLEQFRATFDWSQKMLELLPNG
ncbi:aspartyl protease family protein [Lacipirellula parvula]|uniref:Peptidase A2 domain-containing protein n=1 Tax=Lacipirellula parvula TaxID=2650471 RepID=A0A5K7X8X0_9BACT|nr:aspartyl protease family protein [Lacipirellula parvula]BBO32978.1 hypothetical protein PLANPX_2590 [Lacipirellula parvula]